MNKSDDSQIDAIFRRIWLVVVLIALALIVPLVGFALFLDSRLSSLEDDLAYRPADPTADGPVELDEIPWEPVTGQTVYVPAYSHVYHQDGRPQLLTVTLSIRNTDRSHEVLITSVGYYDGAGQQVKTFVDKPLQLGALASTEFVVSRSDTTGGVGANFLVEWMAGDPVSEPIIEAVMIDTSGNQGLSFVRAGKVIETKDAAENSVE